MHISKELPQFENEKALVLVTGAQDAKIYVAENGKIEEVESFKVDKLQYSDREGHFETRKGGKVIGSGSVYENKDEENLRNFTRELEEKLARFKNESITKVFLFSPGYVLSVIRRALPLSLIAKTEGVIRGNYFDSHPFDLLKMIRGMKPLPASPLKSEARKILSSSNQARQVIKGRSDEEEVPKKQKQNPG